MARFVRSFLCVHGERPSAHHSIDRYPDVDGNYEPGNVRWAIATDQARNKRNNYLITINENTKSLAEWCQSLGLAYGTINSRIRKLGWTPEEALGFKERAVSMTEAEITEIFIRAAEVDRKLPNTARPAQLKAMNVGIIHTFAEMAYWPADELHAVNWAWLEPKNLRATTNDVGIWEVAMEMMKLVPDPKKRRALWAWSRAQAGGMSFSKWCREIEKPGIQRQAGDWRRQAAIECIFRAFARKPLQHNEMDGDADFTNTTEIGDKDVILASDVPTYWRAPDARPMACDFDKGLQSFEWAELQNERRRQRDAEKRKRQVAA
jgi:hypothetical protein